MAEDVLYKVTSQNVDWETLVRAADGGKRGEQPVVYYFSKGKVKKDPVTYPFEGLIPDE